MLARVAVFSLMAGMAFSLLAAPASATIVGGWGLDVGGACPSISGCSPIDYDFGVNPAAATGTVTFTAGAVPFWTVDIDIDVTSLTMTATGGAIDGVDKIVFSNLTFDVTGWSAFESGGSIAGLGSILGTVSGSYQQYLGAATVGSSINIAPVMVDFGSLNCSSTFTGQCGFTVGFADSINFPGLHLDVGETTNDPAQDYEFVWTFNVIVPEPSTATLLGLGLLGLGVTRRRRA